MKDTIFSPLSMSLSTFDQPLPKDRLSEIALPYDEQGNLIEEGPYVFPESASGGLWTTASEFSKWVIAIQNALQEDKQSLFSKKMVEELLTPNPINPYWGLGFEVGRDRWGKEVEHGHYFAHGGWNTGYLAKFIANRNTGDGIVILTNTGPDMTSLEDVWQWQFLENLVDLVGTEFHWPEK